MSQAIAQALLAIEAVNLSPQDPYTWTSGRKSPIYCDNRLIVSYPAVFKQVEEAFVDLIRQHYPEVEVIAGTATAGIPHAAAIAWQMDLPMIYVRSAAKGHGTKSAIEGRLTAGQKVVLVEDLISTGGSVLDAAEKVEAAGAELLGCVAIFSYQLEDAQAAFKAAGHPLHTLSNYLELIEIADLSAADRQSLKEWYQDPLAWSNSRQD